MTDELQRAKDWMLDPPDAKREDAWFVIRDLAARVRELEAERDALRAALREIAALPATGRVHVIANAALAGEKG